MNRTRVVGGTSTSINEWPFVVRIFADQHDVVGFCGGVLITPSRVLTAAHCLDLPVGEVGVFHTEIGSRQTFHPCTGRKTVIYAVKHSWFTRVEAGNDVAILEIDPVMCASYTPIALDDGSVWNDGRFFMLQFAYVAGWGATQASGNGYSQSLREAELYLYSDEQCGALHGTLPSTAGCSGHIYDAVDACFGDSGGPLVVFVNTLPLLVGIVSYGYDMCAIRGLPGIYTRVSEVLPFIEREAPGVTVVGTNAYAAPLDACECTTYDQACLSREVDVSPRCGCAAHLYPDDTEPYCYVRDPFHCTSSVEASFYLGGLGWKLCADFPSIPSSATRTTPVHNYLAVTVVCALRLLRRQ